MTQQGTIKKLLPGGRAEVEVTRRSACGHDCAKCGGCGGLETQTLYVTARNHTDAGIGDRVLIEGETGRVLGLAALVYMLPLVLFFIGSPSAMRPAAVRPVRSSAACCSRSASSARSFTAEG